MWGNALGWFISVLLVALTATGLIFLQNRISGITPTTALANDSFHNAPLELTFSPRNVLAPMDQADAGALYREAIETFEQDRLIYSDFALRGTLSEAPELPALKFLLEAARHGRADIFISHPESVVNYENPRSALEALQTLGQCALRFAQLIGSTDPAVATHYADAAFALGARLCEERLSLAELRLGLSLMTQAAHLIAASDPARSAASRDFIRAGQNFTAERINPMAGAIVTIDPGMIAHHSGDVFYFAKNGRERMWRVEAILALGRMRFYAARVGDQRAAERAIDRLMDDPDPVIRAAATAAKNLTAAQHRMAG